jgi:predicted RNase H-like HicB family nuclease
VNRTRYIALLDGKRGAYGVVFPDLPGCTAMGRTGDEALRNAAEAAAEWIEAVRSPPRPRSVEALRNDPEVKRDLAQGALLMIISAFRKTGGRS